MAGHRLLLRMAVTVLVVVVASAIGPVAGRASADDVSISTDRSQYRVGDTLRYCVDVPGPGQVRIVDQLPDGRSQVINSYNATGGRRCFAASITPPLGTECLRAEFFGAGGGSAQACFEVQSGSGPPPSGPGKISVRVDRGPGATYTVGDPIEICYHAELLPTFAPVRAEIHLIDILPNGASRTLLMSSDLDRCFNSTVTRPTGTETIRADLRICNVTPPSGSCPVAASDRVSFVVAESGPPPPPADGSISVSIDRGPGSTYARGEPVQICYSASTPPVITIFRIAVRLTLLLPDGSSRQLLESTDLSRCITSTADHPEGRHTIRGELLFCNVGAPFNCSVAAVDQVSFFVVGAPPPPPSGAITVNVDRGPGSSYAVGDAIRICFHADVVVAAVFRLEVRLTDILSDDTSRVILRGPDLDRCLDATVTRPLGAETIRAELLFCDLNTPPQCNVGGADDVTFFVTQGQPPPGGASIRTDRGSYEVGDTIRICYTVPNPGPVTIVDILADGSAQVLFSTNDDGSGGCFVGTVTPPTGTECLRLEFTGPLGGGSRRTCFEVFGGGTGGASISTDHFEYRLNDVIQICYSVPGSGSVAVTDLLPDGRSQVILSTVDDGTGGCFSAVVTPPTGIECLRLDYNTTGGAGSTRTCFRVLS